jgi:hypothetical protein
MNEALSVRERRGVDDGMERERSENGNSVDHQQAT